MSVLNLMRDHKLFNILLRCFISIMVDLGTVQNGIVTEDGIFRASEIS